MLETESAATFEHDLTAATGKASRYYLPSIENAYNFLLGFPIRKN